MRGEGARRKRMKENQKDNHHIKQGKSTKEIQNK
jgi:hypothetical protein